MTRATVAAGLAGAAAPLAAWDALTLVEGARLARALGRLLAPLRRAGRDGDRPSPPERRRLALVGALVLAAAGGLLGGSLAAVVAAATGPALAAAVVRERRRRHRAQLERAAPTLALALADALAAGHALQGALVAAAQSASGAAGRELRAVSAALALGEPVDGALERLRRRAGSSAFDTLVAALLLQRDAGGPLATLLRELAASLEASVRLAQDARVATAQARLSAWLVGALPLAAAVLAELADPGSVAGALRTPLSGWLAGAALVLQGIGVVAVRRLARVRG